MVSMASSRDSCPVAMSSCSLALLLVDGELTQEQGKEDCEFLNLKCRGTETYFLHLSSGWNALGSM